MVLAKERQCYVINDSLLLAFTVYTYMHIAVYKQCFMCIVM